MEFPILNGIRAADTFFDLKQQTRRLHLQAAGCVLAA